MAVKKGYKQTEVGVIPEDWSVVSITSLLEKGTTITYGVVQPGSNDPNGVLFVRGGDIYDGKIQTSQLRRIPGSVARQFARTRLVGGEIVVSLVGYPGETAIVPNWLAGANIARQVALIKLISNQQLSTEYVCKYFQSPLGRKLLINESIGSAQQVINLRDIKKVRVVIPPSISEQEAIAGALSDADAWIESLEQLIAKKRQIKQGAMQELLTGKRRLPGFSGKWETKLLGDVAEVKTGPFGSALHEGDYKATGTPIITVEHLGEFGVEHVNLPLVADSDCQRLQAYTLEIGDIVFSRVGSVDRNALIRPEEVGWLFSGRLLRVRVKLKSISSPFLSYQFHGETFISSVRSVAVGQTMACLNTQILKGILIKLPSLEEQTAIATVLSDIDTEIESLELKLAKAREIKQGMMQELLTGRIRLVN